jgi:5'-3' exonuclease
MTALVDSKLMFYNEYQKGKPMLNLFASLASILKQIEYQSNQKVTEVVFLYDIGKSDYRLGLWPRYKSGRVYSHLPEGFKNTYETAVKQIADALGIFSFPISGVEADDLAGILSNKLKGDVVLVTSDHDYTQLPLQFKDRVKLFYIKGWQLLGYEESVEFSGCSTVEQFLLKKTILGDSGDTILGLPSIGPVKFLKWAEHAFKLPDADLKESFLTLCRSTKKPAVHSDYLEHAGISTCSELYDFNMSLGRIMTGVKHLTVEQKAQLNACWVIYSMKDQKFDLEKANSLSEQYSQGHLGPFGDQWSLAGSDLSIFEQIHNRRIQGVSRKEV